jgi:hypothetical protein
MTLYLSDIVKGKLKNLQFHSKAKEVVKHADSVFTDETLVDYSLETVFQQFLIDTSNFEMVFHVLTDSKIRTYRDTRSSKFVMLIYYVSMLVIQFT